MMNSICKLTDHALPGNENMSEKPISHLVKKTNSSNARFIPGEIKISPIGCIGFEKAVISIRSRLIYTAEGLPEAGVPYPLNTYDGKFYVINFRESFDPAAPILKSVPVTSADEIEWLPNTYAEVVFQFPVGLAYQSEKRLLRPNRLKLSRSVAQVSRK